MCGVDIYNIYPCPGPAGAPVLVSWEFLARVLRLGLSCVRPGGKYLTHVSGKVTRYLQHIYNIYNIYISTQAMTRVRDSFSRKVAEVAVELGREADITFTEAFVPSFMEVWVFAQIAMKT